MSQATPSRRSRRNQPLVPTPSKSHAHHITDTWLGDPSSSRQTRVEDVPADYELDEETHWETCFYNSFQRRNRKGKGKDTEDKFDIGDTVLVRGFFKDTHVGVITSLCDVHEKDGDEDEDSIRVAHLHWFLKPKELPKTGAAKEHRDGEIYYTVDQSGAVAMDSILAHCQVLSPKRYTVVVDGDEDTHRNWTWSAADAKDVFLCDTAFYNGLNSDLNWERHRITATKASLASPDLARELWNLNVKGLKLKKMKQKEKQNVTSAKRRKISVEDEEDVPGRRGGGSKTTSTAVESDGESASASESGSESDTYDDDGSADASDADEESEGEPSASEDEPMEEPEEGDVPATPSRKRKRTSGTTTPRRKRQTRAALTPTSKAALASRRQKSKKVKLRITNPASYQIAHADHEALRHLPKCAHRRAMHLLHVSARPEALPGRDAEFDTVLGSVLGVLEGDSGGGCIYISGVPGTGKTATVHAVVRELQRLAVDNATNPFTYVEINGLRLPEPSAAYGVLWEAVVGHDSEKDGYLKVSPKEARKKLEKYFTGGRSGPAGGAFVVLMDELDQLVTAKKDVVYDFFNWPNFSKSKLVVIAVSNTHDLPERVMPAKVLSRMGMDRIKFHPYTREQLVTIVNSRLTASREGLNVKENVIHEDAVRLASAKVAAVNGDARRVLDLSRRAVETVFKGDGNSRIVAIKDMSNVIKEMQNSPTAAYLKDCSFFERVILAAVMKCVKREGVMWVKWGQVTQQCMILYEQLRTDMNSLKPSLDSLRFVLKGLVAAKILIIETGMAAERKGMLERLVMMNMETGEVVRALSDVGGSKWENTLGT